MLTNDTYDLYYVASYTSNLHISPVPLTSNVTCIMHLRLQETTKSEECLLPSAEDWRDRLFLLTTKVFDFKYDFYNSKNKSDYVQMSTFYT